MIGRMTGHVWGALAALWVAGSAQAQENLEVERLKSVADSVAEAKMAEFGAPAMSVAIAVNGEVLFAGGYGTADLEWSAAAGPETVYRISSITKQFTAAIIMRLAEQGEIGLDDPITEYLPDYPVQGHHVTVRHLLNHTSGIKSFSPMAQENEQRFRLDLSYEEMVDLFGKQPFDFPPGEQFRYNNMGYYLLGEIIGRVSGTPYAEYVERELLRPIGLQHTWYCDARRVIPRRADGYQEVAGERVHAPYFSMHVGGAAGALCSTARDLVRWAELLHNGQVVSPESLRQMTAPTVTSTGETIPVGLGLGLDQLGEHRSIAIAGGERGFGSVLTHYPSDGLTIAVLANSSPGVSQPQRVEEAFARVAFGMEIRDLPLSHEDITRYEGVYTLQMGPREIDLHVFGEGGQLMAQPGPGRAFRLLYQGNHVFVSAQDYDDRFEFTVEDGRAVSISINGGGPTISGARKR